MVDMQVIMTIASLDRDAGGTSRAVAATARHLAQVGCAVTLLSFDRGRPALDVEDESSLTVQRVEKGRQFWEVPGDLRRFGRKLKATIDRDRPAVIHDNGIWLPVNHRVAQIARETGVPRLVSTHGMMEPWSLNHKSLKKRLAWKLYQKRDLKDADVLHATAEEEAETLRHAGFDQPIAIAPNGIELPSEGLSPVVGKSSSDPSVCLFLSRIHKVKGLINLVEAWSQLRPGGWKVVVAGPDEDGHKSEVQRHARNHGVESDFDFVGPVAGEQKEHLFRHADMFVLPTHSENFGIVVAEALSYGVPVITTRGAPWRDLERHDCGWWIDIGADPLAQALQEAVGLSRADRQAMGARGRTLVEQKYTWPRVAKRLKQTYAWMVGQCDKPECAV